MNHAERIARIRIVLDDWQPAIWRRVEVPLTATLKALHEVIQAAMPYDNHHLFDFRAGAKRYAIPNPEWDSLRKKARSAKTTRLGNLVDRGVEDLIYTYDFGDNWRHTVTIEAVIDADPAVQYPLYVEGAGRAPPEDVGGIPGFELFLTAMADPQHPQHRELQQWYGRPFKSAEPDISEIHIRIGKLAQRRALGKASFKKSHNRRL